MNIVLEDIRVNGGKNLKSCAKVLLINHSLHLLLLLRLGCAVRKFGLLGAALGTIVEYLIRIIFSSDISCRAKFGRRLIIMHGHDIVIGSEVIVGDNVKIFNGVTLGNRYTETNVIEQPIIGNNVVVGTGAKILGKVKIGDNVLVGANSVVINDVPINHTAIGIPAKHMPRKLI